uniref:Delta-like protein n=1 Tax=Rhabditophanes sp. KR3021 TaxID=114890 RepID=A0AC35TNX5_9BILA
MFSVNFMKIIFITLITILQSLAQTNNTTQSKFICPKSFYGPDCRRICVETDKYPNKLCDSEGLTRCKDGWTGLLCDRPICTESCGRGVCVAPNLCRCLSGTMGKECKECKPKKGCQHGYCNKAGECLCNNDWTGTLCQFKKDVCTTSNPCQNGGMCLQESNAGYECLCPYNLFGGIVDLIDMLLCGVYVGFLTLNGWDYFNKTAFVMPIGNVCFGFWTSVLILTNILSFQRVLVMVAPDLTETLFDGKRTWIWIATPLPVVIWIIFCQPAFVYSPFVKTFILSPYVGYNSTNTHLYTSIVQEVINLGGAILIVVNYLIFIMVIIYNSVSESQNVSKIIDPIHIRLFVQTVLISLVTLFAAVAYVVMNYITSITVTITVITHVCYLLMHCFPPIIYLAINKTLKTTIRKWFQKEGIKTTNGKFVPVNPKNKPSSDTPNFEDPKRKDVLVGSLYIGFAVIYILIYLPFLFAMTSHLKQSVYKIMFILGIFDILDLVLGGGYTGFLTLNGWDAFSHPYLVMPVGTSAFALWAMVMALTNVLAFQRVLVMTFPDAVELLFEGKKTLIWIILPIPFIVWMTLFAPIFVYSPFIKSFMLNPFVGYKSTNTFVYTSKIQEIVNFGGPSLIILNYVVFFVILLYNFKSNSGRIAGFADPIHIRLFIQIVTISFFTLIAGTLFVMENYLTSMTDLITVTCHLIYLSVHGVPGIMFLFVNKTLKLTIKQWLNNVFKKDGQSTIVVKLIP